MNEAPTGGTARASNLSVTCEKPTMTSIATQISTINVPFHGDNLSLVSFNGQPHVPMKPVVEGMGLAWQPQHEKLKTRFSKGITEIVIPTKGGDQSMTCLALRKLAGWLHTINVGKVRPELRDKVARYQEECDDVLYQYWIKGEVVNPRKKTTVDQRTPLRDAVNMLVGKKGLRYDDAYNMVHQRFAIDSIDELALEQIPQAVEYIHRVVLDGEYLGKQDLLPAKALDIEYPLTWWNQYDYVMKGRGVSEFSHDSLCRLPVKMLFGDCADAPSPGLKMLHELSEAGFEVEAVKLEILAHRHYAEVMYSELERIRLIADSAKDRAAGFRISPPAKSGWR
ncbi:phage antirepressor N-terminal domain-containing protein [Serratia ficaria]|uniref:phage antirepressor N-terminal domain-containing protein n=1 Tax=Serratia ficaria TaxID=61651 RepID=UPI0021C97894|nr:phage antirepressor N-terminal domain-containing protein [Serratia ficaria]